MTNSKPIYDLEERTFQFAKRVRLYVKKLPKNTANKELHDEVIQLKKIFSAIIEKSK